MADDEKRIETYAEFWPYYLREHSKPETRRLHYLGTLIGLGVAVAGVVTGNYWWLLLALIPGYAFAWVGHFVIEKNRPATFKYPLWSFISDFRMCALFLTGKLEEELKRAGVDTEH